MYINNKFNYKRGLVIVKKMLPFIIIGSLAGCAPSESDSLEVIPSSEHYEITSTMVTTPANQIIEEQFVSINSEEEIKTELNEIIEDVVIVNDPEEEKIEKKIVALTFDDGPSKYTSELVDILEENGASATFFIIGNNIDHYPDSVVKAYVNGNEIAVHSLTHTSFKKMSIEDIKNEIDITRQMLDGIDVEYSNLVRPPYGSINQDIIAGIDTSFILWSIDTEDWKSRDKDSVKEEVNKSIKDGSIILFHDLYPSTIEAIREILPELSEEYDFVSVSELFERKEKELETNHKYSYVKE